MRVNIARFYKRERWELDCEIITPMFLGNAEQEAELRAAPFKGMLRYWWRVANGAEYETHESLLAAENRIFGSADEAGGGKSRVTVRVGEISGMQPAKNDFGNIHNVRHPECRGDTTNPLNYLAGMGLIHYRNGIQHSYFPVGGRFRLIIDAAGNTVNDVEAAMACFTHFAAIGSRSRNGWGCFAVTDNNGSKFQPKLVNWNDALDKDYPHCLGRDEKGPLLWKARQTHDDWKQCMRELAQAYIDVRVCFQLHGSEPHPRQLDRHLLGYPLTNHNVVHENRRLSWGTLNRNGRCRPTRHASALRLFVRREDDRYRGYFLHLPHAFSKKMWPGDKERQTKIWTQVHNTLDRLCERVTSGEVAS